MKNTRHRFQIRRDSDGCDDQLVIFDAKTKKDLVYTIYWDCDPEWTKRAIKTAQFVTRALNNCVCKRRKGGCRSISVCKQMKARTGGGSK